MLGNKKIKFIEIPYELVKATVRNALKMAYLFCEAHDPKIIP